MKLTALLPMKAHSERVPNKNIRDFCGKPLYQRILDSLLSCAQITEIIINTDSEIIAYEAPGLSDRVRVIIRPERLRGDFVPMNDIIAYDIAQSESEHFLQTHSTNPLLSSATISKAIDQYFASLNTHDSIFSVTRLQTRLYWQDGSPVNHDPEELLRTQDLPPVYEENSNIYIFSRASFKAAESKRIGRRPMMFETDKLEAIDIDEEEDYKLAEAVYRLKNP